MSTIVKLFKTKIFEISTILCFLLPPVGILLLFILGFTSMYKTWKEQKQLYFSLISCFFLCLFISTIGAITQIKNVSLLVVSMMILGYWGLYLRILTSGNKENFKYYRWIMIFGGLYNCLIGLADKWLFMHPMIGLLTGTKLIGSQDYSRIIGSAYNPNFTVYLLLLSIAFVFAEMLTNIQKKQFIVLSWQLPILLVLSNGVIATGSRSGYFAMVCIYFLFFIRMSKIIFMMSFIFVLVLSKWLFEIMPRNDYVNQSYQGREKIWSNSLELWSRNSFFGTTPLGFKQEYIDLFHEAIPHSHSIFIGFFAEYGIIGGVAFLVLLCTTIYKCVSLFFFKEKNNGLLDYFLLSLPIIILTGVLDEPIFSPQIALLTIILLGYWDKYSRSFTFSFLVLPSIKLKKIQKRQPSYENGFRYGVQNLK